MKRFSRKHRKHFATLAVSSVAFIVSAGNASAATLPPTNNLVLWLKPESLALANGASVNFWADSSGNTNDAVSLTATYNAPIYVANGINGRPSVQFGPGINDALVLTNQFDPPSGEYRLPLPSGLTFAGAFRTFSSLSATYYTGDAALSLLGDSTAFVNVGFGITGGVGALNRYDNLVSSSWNYVSGTGALNHTNVYPGHYLIATHRNDTGTANDSVNLFADGRHEATANVPYNAFTAVNLIGHGRVFDDFDGLIGEILVYSADLSTADRLQLQTYLTERWLDVPEPSAALLLALASVLLWRRKYS